MPFNAQAQTKGDQADVFMQDLANRLLKALQDGAIRTKDAAAAHTGTLLHGPGGLFSTSGLEEPIISTHVRSRGLGEMLPAYPSVTTDPRFGLLTGISGDQGSEPVNPCDDAPTGYLKGGTLTAKFGHVARDTRTIRTPDIIRQINRGEFTDLRLLNSVLNPETQGVYRPQDLSAGDLIDNAVEAEQVIAGVNMERKLSKLLWTGDASVSTAQEGYVEFPGLDNQVATSQVDAETNTALPSADSTILNLGHQVLGNFDVVEPVSEIEDYLYSLSEDTGVDAQFVVVMRSQMWKAISEVWPVQYNTQPNYLNAENYARYILDAGDMVNSRDSMRQSMTIQINGRTYPVVTDAGIAQDDNITNPTDLDNNQFSSPIYFLPLTINGGFPVLYWEYLNHQLSVSPEFISRLNGNETFWSDGGRFLWSMDGQYTCFKLKMETDPRVVLRTPWLAAKIDEIVYERAFAARRQADPDDTYWVDGGVSIRNLDPSGYSVW